MRNKNRPARILYRFLIAGCYVFLSAHVFSIWIHGHEQLGFERATFSGMMNGTAAKPFVDRTLLPTTVRLTATALPAGFKDVTQRAIIRAIRRILHDPEAVLTHKWNNEHVLEYALAMALTYLFLLGFMLVFRRLLNALYLTPGWVRDILPMIAVLVLPVFFHAGTHFVYDFPALFFFTLLLLLLWRKNWLFFYPVFILALLNKETALLISLVFAIHCFPRMARSVFFCHLLGQSGIFVLLKSALSVIHKNSPGALLEFYLRENFFLSAPYSYGVVSAMAMLVLLVFSNYSKKHIFLRNSIFIMIPLLPLHICFGLAAEIRVYYEAYPVLLLLAGHTVADILKIRFEISQPSVLS
jgi:hypothetical protein